MTLRSYVEALCYFYRMQRFFKKAFLIKMVKFFFIGIAIIVSSIFLCDYIIVKSTKPYLYQNVVSIPNNKAGLVLGTSQYLSSGAINLYFKYRIEAAAALYHAGKISVLIISGDHGSKGYNEPEDMKNALIAKGVPDSVIHLDYAGFRTLDSVVRADKVFGQKKITIISQKFHNERAVFLAGRFGITAIGLNAGDVPFQYGYRIQLREKIARFKVFIDLLLGVSPRYLGETISI